MIQPKISVLNQLVSKLVVANEGFRIGLSPAALLPAMADPIRLAHQDPDLTEAATPLHQILEQTEAASLEQVDSAFKHLVSGVQSHIAGTDDATQRLFESVQRRWAPTAAAALQHPPDQLGEAQILALLETIIKPFPHPMGVFELDPKRGMEEMARLLKANPANDETSGFKPNHLIEMGPSFRDNVHEEDRSRFDAFVMGIFSQGIGTIDNVRLLKGDGSYMWANIHVATLPVGTEGRRIGYYVLFDETERHKAVTAMNQAMSRLQQAHDQIKRFQEVLDNAWEPLAVLIIDQSGKAADQSGKAAKTRPLLFNQALQGKLGYSEDELAKMKPGEHLFSAELFPPEQHQQLADHSQAYFNTGQLDWRDAQMQRKDGQTVMFDIQATPSSAGDEFMALVSFKDAGMRRQLEAQVAQASVSKSFLDRRAGVEGEMAQAIDDLNAAMIDSIGELEKQGDGRTPQLDLATLRNLQTDVDRITRVLTNLPGHDVDRGTPTPVGLHQALEKDLFPFPVRHRAEFTYELADEDGLVMGPRAELRQIVDSLLQNAIEAAEKRDTVKIRIATARFDITRDVMVGLGVHLSFSNAKPGSYVKLSVEDDGPGMPNEEWSAIFHPGYTTREPYIHAQGTGHLGMGLTNVRHLVSKRGGFVHVSSKPGKTLFDIYLPLVETPAESDD